MEQNFYLKNADHYIDPIIQDYDYYFINFIKKDSKHKASNLLDIGGATGKIARLVIKECPNIGITILDPSMEMLNVGYDINIKKVVGSLPKDISICQTFNYIHIKDVFHHVTSYSIKQTKTLLKESLVNIKMLLKDDGVLFVHEIYYETPILQSLPSIVIYYLCKLQNKFGIKIPMKEFLLGLEVYFYTRKELRAMLEDCGYEILDLYDINSFKKNPLFLKRGRMIFICRKR